MKVLTDFHHHALAESLLRLFEDRFGAQVYFPVGMEWFDEGVWQFERAWHGDAVARQYLQGIWADATVSDGEAQRSDPRHLGRTQRGLTLSRARDMKFDFVISSLPDNDEGFHRLAGETGAKFGVQIGNEAQMSKFELADFILSSSTLPGLIDRKHWAKPVTFCDKPTVIYHQEFDLETFGFDPAFVPDRDRVATFVNCFPETPPYEAFREFARRTSDQFDWRVYGSYGSKPLDEFAGGDISRVDHVAELMKRARIGWHTKFWSDGFGHVLHNWAALGRPLVGSASYYQTKLGGPLWVDGVTSWDTDSRSEAEIVAVMLRLRDDDEFWMNAATAMAARFREIVDFDAEADAIRSILF